ncbi:retrovirus-related pol polyprotein from transposon TNT 1-94 [Tanacetum coccineum]
MANLSEDIQCAGSDTRPPMLDRTDFASWQQRIRLYCQGKENGVNILKSIDEGSFQMGTFRVTLTKGTEGAPHLGPERPRVYSDLSPEDKERYNADIRATNILLQGLPKDIYSLINHYTDAKDIWDNVKMLLEGSELTKEDRESQLYDDFEHFRQHKGETIHDYYVRFAKLINDMRNIKMTMSRMQLNSKFVNNMLPEWGRFVTAVKLNRGLRDSNYDQLYAYLKQHEAHANENKMLLDRFTQHTVDPLALISNVAPQQYNSQSSTNLSSTYVPPHFADNSQLDSGLSPTDNLIKNLTNTLALLTQSYKTYLPQTNNQLRTSSNPRNQATVQDGRVMVQNVQGRQNRGQVRFGNNHFTAITRHGDYVQGNLTICHVYYVEGLRHNLFSIKQFCDGDVEVAIHSNTCYVQNLEGEDLLTGSRDSNLYTISNSEMAASSLVCLMSKATLTKSWLWHRRLSHLNLDTNNHLNKQDLVDGLLKFKYDKDHLCSACEQEKSKKATLSPKLVPSTKSKLELIHMDLCGPIRVECINGKRYIQVQILKVRSDNGTEFKNEILRTFLCYPTNDRGDLGKMKPKADIEDTNSIPSKEDFENLFGPMYEEYYATRSPEVSDIFAVNTLDNEDTPSSSSIVVEENEAL